MIKTIMITGATDGIGLETAKKMASLGHNLIIHGRNAEKISRVTQLLKGIANVGEVNHYVADLSELKQVRHLAEQILNDQANIDVLINNAGIFKTKMTTTADNLDVRFAVNTVAPYLLSKLLMPVLNEQSRIINLSSAAQAPVVISALLQANNMADMEAYAQSKRAIRLWTKALSKNENNPTMVSVNPGSLLASKMVAEGFGVKGNDISIGVNIITSLSFDKSIQSHNGEYFDNDNGTFSDDIPVDVEKQQSNDVVSAIEIIIARL